MVHPGKAFFFAGLLFLLCIDLSATAQDTTGFVRIDNGSPASLKRISVTQLEPSLQKKGLKLATSNGYKAKNDWGDTIRYWSDEENMRAVSFLNSSYEHTTIIFNQAGKWLQTASYLNPEFTETSRIITAVEEKGYGTQSLSSPIGSIIKYRTTHDTWYEAGVYEYRAPGTTLTAVLNEKFQVIEVRK